jgi:hypothetical protein
MIDVDVKLYHESLGKELQAIKNRVRNLIGATNWAEESATRKQY